MSDPTRHPNFPVNLAIGPSRRYQTETDLDEYEQGEAIQSYGIAGRIWDASYPILPYLSAPSDRTTCQFSPASTIFPQAKVDSRSEGEESITILELGSGQSMATIHLLDEFKRATGSFPPGGKRHAPKVFLSDLPDVLPLCRRSVERWQERHNDVQQEDVRAAVDVVPLPWGDLEMGNRLAEQLAAEKRTLTHVLLIDLVYFPHLYSSLLRTLLQVTSSPFSRHSEGLAEPVGGPEVILSYKTRSLEFEEPFFLALGRYFRMEPLLVQPRLPANAKSTSDEAPDWSVHGVCDETYTYICQRWSRTLRSDWAIPSTDAALMNGSSAEGTEQDGESSTSERQAQDRAWGWVENQLAAIEWD